MSSSSSSSVDFPVVEDVSELLLAAAATLDALADLLIAKSNE
jgi:hypothetical protein